MSTPYSDIFNLFLFNIQDYLIDEMYGSSVSDFETYATNFLLKAIPRFRHCEKDLTNRNDTTKVFTADLTDDEKDILANLMTLAWLIKEINNILEMRNILTSGDYKAFSAANNLKEKRNWYETLSGDVDRQLVEYGYDNNDWDNFFESST